MPSKMGRPKAVNPKSLQLTVRMDKAAFEKLDKVAAHYGISRAETVRKGIEKLYGEIK